MSSAWKGKGRAAVYGDCLVASHEAGAGVTQVGLVQYKL